MPERASRSLRHLATRQCGSCDASDDEYYCFGVDEGLGVPDDGVAPSFGVELGRGVAVPPGAGVGLGVADGRGVGVAVLAMIRSIRCAAALSTKR